MPSMQAFILAGGFATRLWPLTEKRAKPLLPLAGQPLITQLVEKIPAEMPVTISTNAAFAEMFNQWEQQMDRPHLHLLIETSRKDEQKIGALGAVADWITQENIDEDILLLTGDNYLGFSVPHFLSHYREGVPLLAAYDIKDKAKASLFGVVIVDPLHPQQIVGFEEKPKEPKTTLVSTGCSILPRGILPVLVEYAVTHPDNVGGIFEELLKRKVPVECFTFTEHWLDIGSFASYLDAHRLIVGEQTLLQEGAHLEKTECTGSVSIAKGSHITGSSLHDCIIFEDCEITDCVLRNCIVDDHAKLQGVDLSDKMLREGTVLVQKNAP
jgi:glucose-1-phosphate thymidylyltransferase